MAEFMTDAEAIEAVRNGGRAHTPTSIVASEDTSLSPKCVHSWRTIACYRSETDVSECSRCGRQIVHACDFDDDFA